MKLILNNFKSHKDYEVEFPDTGLVLLKGETGSGKTTILEGIYDAITGKAEDVTPWTGEKSATVVLEITDDFCIKRTHNPETLTVVADDITYLDEEAQEIIYRRLGMTEQEFMASCYIKQELAGSLLSLSQADQLRFIQRLAFGDQDPEVFKKRIAAQIDRRMAEKKTAESVLGVRKNYLEECLKKRIPLPQKPEKPEIIFTEKDWNAIKSEKYELLEMKKHKNEEIENIEKLLKHPVHEACWTFKSKELAHTDLQNQVEALRLDLESKKTDMGKSWATMSMDDTNKRLFACETKKAFFSWKQEVAKFTESVKQVFPEFSGIAASAFLEKQAKEITEAIALATTTKFMLIKERHNIIDALKRQKCPECGIPLAIQDGKIIAAEDAAEIETLESNMIDVESQLEKNTKELETFGKNLEETKFLLRQAVALKAKAIKDPLPEFNTIEELTQEIGRLNMHKITQEKLEYILQRAETDLETKEQQLAESQKKLDELDKILKEFALTIPTEDKLKRDREQVYEEIQKIDAELEVVYANETKYLEDKKNLAIYDERIKVFESIEREIENAQNALKAQDVDLNKATKRWAASVRLKEVSDAAAVRSTESTIASINEQAKVYIDRMFPHGGTSIRILNGMTTQKGEDRAKLSLEVIHNGVHVGRRIKPLSGGEKDRSMLSFQLAMSDLYKAPFMILDEPFSSVDVFHTLDICLALLKEKSVDRLIIMTQHGVPEGEFDQVVTL